MYARGGLQQQRSCEAKGSSQQPTGHKQVQKADGDHDCCAERQAWLISQLLQTPRMSVSLTLKYQEGVGSNRMVGFGMVLNREALVLLKTCVLLLQLWHDNVFIQVCGKARHAEYTCRRPKHGTGSSPQCRI